MAAPPLQLFPSRSLPPLATFVPLSDRLPSLGASFWTRTHVQTAMGTVGAVLGHLAGFYRLSVCRLETVPRASSSVKCTRSTCGPVNVGGSRCPPSPVNSRVCRAGRPLKALFELSVLSSRRRAVIQFSCAMRDVPLIAPTRHARKPTWAVSVRGISVDSGPPHQTKCRFITLYRLCRYSAKIRGRQKSGNVKALSMCCIYKDDNQTNIPDGRNS